MSDNPVKVNICMSQDYVKYMQEKFDIENEDEPQTPREKRQVIKAGKRFAEMNPGFFLGGSYIRLSDVLLVLQIILLWKLYKRG